MAFKKVASEVYSLDENCPEITTWDLGVWEGLFTNLTLFVVLNFRNEKLSGFLAMSHVQDEAELLRICVKQEHRREKIGSLLIEQAISTLDQSSVERIHLEVREDNTPAIKLYQSIGFKKVGKRKAYYSKPLCDAHLYALELEH